MASPNDLTSLADLKAWLGVTSTADDTVLSALITEISVAILTNLGRATILPAIYTETRDGGGETSIVPRHWPIGQVLSFTIDGMPVSIATSTAAPGGQVLSAILDSADPAPPGGLQRLSMRRGPIPNGIQNVVISYRAGYEISAEAAIVPTTAPFVVAARAPYGPWQVDGAVAHANGAALVAGSAPGSGVYAVSAGVYTFSPSDAGAAITLRYGYIPYDLSRCCREWAAERYAYRARIGQSSKSLGGQETAAFIVKDIPDFVSRLLQPYRRVIGP
jgi:hypothetical protein